MSGLTMPRAHTGLVINELGLHERKKGGHPSRTGVAGRLQSVARPFGRRCRGCGWFRGYTKPPSPPEGIRSPLSLHRAGRLLRSRKVRSLPLCLDDDDRRTVVTYHAGSLPYSCDDRLTAWRATWAVSCRAVPPVAASYVRPFPMLGCVAPLPSSLRHALLHPAGRYPLCLLRPERSAVIRSPFSLLAVL